MPAELPSKPLSPRATVQDFLDAVAKCLGIDLPPGICAESDISSDVGLDSLQAFEFMVIIDELSGRQNSSLDTIPEAMTIGDAYGYVMTAVRSVAHDR